jgi:hypothetical protein
MAADRKPATKKKAKMAPSKRRADPPVSLHPMKFTEAVEALLGTRAPTKPRPS